MKKRLFDFTILGRYCVVVQVAASRDGWQWTVKDGDVRTDYLSLVRIRRRGEPLMYRATLGPFTACIGCVKAW
jgi:hypothetical protein